MRALEYCKTCRTKTAPAAGEHPESHWNCSVCGDDYWAERPRLMTAARWRREKRAQLTAAEIGAWVAGGLNPDRAAVVAERVAASPRLTRLAQTVREELAKFDDEDRAVTEALRQEDDRIDLGEA